MDFKWDEHSSKYFALSIYNPNCYCWMIIKIIHFVFILNRNSSTFKFKYSFFHTFQTIADEQSTNTTCLFAKKNKTTHLMWQWQPTSSVSHTCVWTYAVHILCKYSLYGRQFLYGFIAEVENISQARSIQMVNLSYSQE